MFVVVKRNDTTYTVGHYQNGGEYSIDREFPTYVDATLWCSFMNGGIHPDLVIKLNKLLDQVQIKVDFMTLLKDKKGH